MAVVCAWTNVLVVERQGKLVPENRLKLNLLKMRGQRKLGLTA